VAASRPSAKPRNWRSTAVGSPLRNPCAIRLHSGVRGRCAPGPRLARNRIANLRGAPSASGCASAGLIAQAPGPAARCCSPPRHSRACTPLSGPPTVPDLNTNTRIRPATLPHLESAPFLATLQFSSTLHVFDQEPDRPPRESGRQGNAFGGEGPLECPSPSACVTAVSSCRGAARSGSSWCSVRSPRRRSTDGSARRPRSRHC